MARADLAELEARLGHTFGDRKLLIRALTHRSYFQSHRPQTSLTTDDNEQLEFLGDSVLGFLVAECMVQAYPQDREGQLSKRKNVLVSARHLSEVARQLDLGRFLLLGKGEESSGGRDKTAILSDALEAVIAAVYLDGGIAAARSIVRQVVVSEIEADAPVLVDHKSALQELVQARKLELPEYVLISADGPGHARRFVVEARVGDLAYRGEGSSKKAASQCAAEGLLGLLLPQPGASAPAAS